ncbi:hypothetical protein AVEN_126331-1, partial [Araneus ventricosus]
LHGAPKRLANPLATPRYATGCIVKGLVFDSLSPAEYEDGSFDERSRMESQRFSARVPATGWKETCLSGRLRLESKRFCVPFHCLVYEEKNLGCERLRVGRHWFSAEFSVTRCHTRRDVR